MYICIALLLIAFLPHLQLSADVPTAKTFFKLSNAPLWLSPESLPFQYTKKPTDAPIQNGFTLTAFYSRSTEKKRLGQYLGFYDDTDNVALPFIRVTTDTTVAASLRPQDIAHDVVHSSVQTPDPAPLTETINFNPYIEQFGVVFTNGIQINKWISVYTIMPWMQIRHTLGLKSSSVQKKIIENNLYSVTDFFTGAFHQEAATNPNQQDKLLYGKLVNKQSRSGLADITLLCLATPHINDAIELQLGGLVTIPTSTRAHGVYLFEPTLGSGGHTILGAHLRAQTHITDIKLIQISAGGSATIRIGISSQEIRSPSFLLNYDGGVDAQYGRYALAGKQNARRLFPLINMLTQMVTVKPGSTIECEAHIAAQYKNNTFALEYRYTHTGAEKVSPIFPWPAATYAIAKHTYSQTTNNNNGVVTGYNTFDIAQNSDLLNNTDLTESAIAFDACATPTQKTHLFGASFKCVPSVRFPHTNIQLRGYYAFANTHAFGVGGYGVSASLSHTF